MDKVYIQQKQTEVVDPRKADTRTHSCTQQQQEKQSLSKHSNSNRNIILCHLALSHCSNLNVYDVTS